MENSIVQDFDGESEKAVIINYDDISASASAAKKSEMDFSSN